jgi:hypothetical protein
MPAEAGIQNKLTRVRQCARWIPARLKAAKLSLE